MRPLKHLVAQSDSPASRGSQAPTHGSLSWGLGRACRRWALLLFVLWCTPLAGQDLLERASSKRMRAFEARLTQNINDVLQRYLTPSRHALSVKVIWNRDVLPPQPEASLTQKKQKLPGFSLYVQTPGVPLYESSTPPFARLVVKVLLDETLPPHYERFLRKIIPIVARFDAQRGDQVVILKEKFPAEAGGAAPPALSEQELLGSVFPSLSQRPREAPPAKGNHPAGAARTAYEEGRYQDAIAIIQSAFQQALNNQERSLYAGMEGSLLYTMKDYERALRAWKRALRFDPTNMEVQRVMRFIETRQWERKP